MKDGCCCGATKSNPCICMKKGITKCSSKAPKCPCYAEMDKKDGKKESFEKAWYVVKNEKEELPPEAPFHSTEEEWRAYYESERNEEDNPLPTSGKGPIEYEDDCPHCGASTNANPVIDDRIHPDRRESGAYMEHDIIDYGLDGDYYQTYKCFNCSGEWENRYSFSEVVLR